MNTNKKITVKISKILVGVVIPLLLYFMIIFGLGEVVIYNNWEHFYGVIIALILLTLISKRCKKRKL